MRTLTTFDEVVKALGGHKAIAQICQRPVQAVYNWQSRGHFPAVLIRPITHELTKLGCIPHDRLFRLQKISAA